MLFIIIALLAALITSLAYLRKIELKDLTDHYEDHTNRIQKPHRKRDE